MEDKQRGLGQGEGRAGGNGFAACSGGSTGVVLIEVVPIIHDHLSHAIFIKRSNVP